MEFLGDGLMFNKHGRLETTVWERETPEVGPIMVGKY